MCKFGFTVLEENNGTLVLSITDDKNNFVFVCAYAPGFAENLAWDLNALLSGDSPEGWDGNELEEFNGDDDVFYLTNGQRLDEDGYIKDVETKIIMRKEAGAEVEIYHDRAGFEGQDMIKRFEAGETALG